jgi:uncharacterized protein YcbK (DUF882 family)
MKSHIEENHNHVHATAILHRDVKRVQTQLESAQDRFEVGSVYRELRRIQRLERRSKRWSRRSRVEP